MTSTDVVDALGLDREKLTEFLAVNVNEHNLNSFGRFDALKESVDKAKAKTFFEAQEGKVMSVFAVNIKIEQYLKDFVLMSGNNGF